MCCNEYKWQLVHHILYHLNLISTGDTNRIKYNIFIIYFYSEHISLTLRLKGSMKKRLTLRVALMAICLLQACGGQGTDTQSTNDGAGVEGVAIDSTSSIGDSTKLTSTPVKAEVDDNRVINIPVVFHVLYANTDQNVPLDSIKAEVANLQKDFMGENADRVQVDPYFKNKNLIGTPRVRFYLAKKSNGEDYVIRNRKILNFTQLYRASTPLETKKFLNVYIGNLPVGKDGFTLEPQGDGSITDVIQLDYASVGGHYRLLTHEAGHWLGLYHVFEGEKPDYGCEGAGDEINDTPPQKHATDGNCLLCPPNVPVQNCSPGTPSNYNNFMDYSGCRKMFTREQVDTMRATVRRVRTELWAASATNNIRRLH
jgi:hypothetical protein